jgi:heat shock protein HtpX
MGKRIFLFIAVNILILATLSITLSLLGVGHYFSSRGINYQNLMTFCLVWGMGGAFISLALSRVMAKWMMGVVVIPPDTREPEVGYYPSPEVNAFATGPTRNRALVAVSAGLLQRMDRTQLEGVLGHEIAHISNGDMVTMTLVQGVINAIVMFLARVIAFFIANRGRDEESSSAPNYLVIFALEMGLSVLGMLVVSAFSRRREFRADEGGAKLAGRTSMIKALEALQSTVAYADLTHKEALATLKISGKPKGFFALFSTHPPLEERIERLKSSV